MATKAVFLRIGEGAFGDYDPDDPVDVELLRFDIYNEDGDELDLEASYCTNVPASTPQDEQARLLTVISAAYDEGISPKVLSWIAPGWTLADARAMNEKIYGKVFAHYENLLRRETK